LDVDNLEKYAINRQELKNKFKLIEVRGSPVYSWLIKRLQYSSEKFLYSPEKNYLLILNLTPSGKILGSQKRLFKGYNKYLTFSASKLHEILNLEIVPDEIDTISQLFGIMQIDFNKPVTLFEGPLDSFLFKNSIGNLGAHKKFPIDLQLRYWFDDDKDGRNKTIEYLEKGNNVFLWSKFKGDFGLPPRKKWDLNDALLFLKENNIKVYSFEKYFSNDPLDIIDI
jgi:hypothetical protein